MKDHDTVLDAVQDSLGAVTMSTPVEQIVAVGSARRRRRLAGGAGAAAVAGLAVAVTTFGGPPPSPADSSAGGVHVHAAAYTVDGNPDGTLSVTWDKEKYFEDHEGLQSALRQAGFPVLIKVGEFCRGPRDDGNLGTGGVGEGVDRVMKGEQNTDGKVTFVFTPSAMPAGTQLFIGYLTPAQQATDGRLGSVERLVPTEVPLTCTTDAPPRS
ncbi:MAG: hypothetical protein ABIQ18_35135 [Umezawaea sp.]